MAGLVMLCGQTQVDLRKQARGIDFTAATTTKPFKSGTALPATCGVGEVFFNTSSPAGSNVYACTATNIWTLEGGGVFASGSGAPSGSCTVGQGYNDTVNGNTWFCESPGSWQKALTTPNTGAFVMTGQNGTTPSTATAGNTSLFFSSAAKTGQTVDDAGGVGTMVRPKDCSTTGQMVQKINTDATVTCAGASAVTYNFPAGSGSSGSPQMGAWWQDGSTTASCPPGVPYQCFLHWNSGSSLIAITTSVPHTWNGGAVSVSLTYQGSGSSNTVQPAVSTGCVANGSAGFAFNTAQNFPIQATSGNTYYISTVPSVTMTGCGADSMMVVRFSRVDSSGFLNLAAASITFNLP
jgi:hypothetical protein